MLQKAKNHFKRVDPKLHRALRSLSKEDQRGIEMKVSRRIPTAALFEDICWTIIGQQLSGKAANTIYGRFKALCGKKVTPNIVSSKSLEDFRSVGISYAKGRALHDFSSKVQEGIVNLKSFPALTDVEVKHALVQVRGIGPWTAEMTLMFSLGRPDVFSYGDLGLQKGIMEVHGFRTKPDYARMETLSKKWSPYRTYAALTLWRYLDTKKTRAP